MSHMVIYRGVDGKPGYHQTDDIHDAVNFVEQMRNEEGVEHARIFRLEEVVFEYRPYYRVELTDASSGQAELANDPSAALEENGTSGQVGPGDASEAETSDEAATVDVVEATEANGEVKAEVGGQKKGLFGR
ncbi:MAG: hypothetical protein WBM50_00250 [Acidimicrobiales bacterium]